MLTIIGPKVDPLGYNRGTIIRPAHFGGPSFFWFSNHQRAGPERVPQTSDRLTKADHHGIQSVRTSAEGAANQIFADDLDLARGIGGPLDRQGFLFKDRFRW